MPWEEVKKEMVNEKGLSEEAADQIGEYVSMQGETLRLSPRLNKTRKTRGVIASKAFICSFYTHSNLENRLFCQQTAATRTRRLSSILNLYCNVNL